MRDLLGTAPEHQLRLAEPDLRQLDVASIGHQLAHLLPFTVAHFTVRPLRLSDQLLGLLTAAAAFALGENHLRHGHQRGRQQHR